MSEELNLEDLLKTWHLQDTFRDIALELITRGANMGALTMSKNVILRQISNGNRTLNHEEMMKLVQLSAKEVTVNTTKMVNELRNPND